MSKERQGYILYHDDMSNVLQELNDAQLGALIRQLTAYSITGTDTRSDIKDTATRIYYGMLAEKIDRDKDRYADMCEKNRKNVKKRYDRIPPYTTVNDRIPNLPTETKTEAETEAESETEAVTETESSFCDCYGLFNSIKNSAITHYEQKQLDELLTVYSDSWVRDAIHLAADNNKPSIGYIKGILNNWASRGRDSVKTSKQNYDQRSDDLNELYEDF